MAGFEFYQRGGFPTYEAAIEAMTGRRCSLCRQTGHTMRNHWRPRAWKESPVARHPHWPLSRTLLCLDCGHVFEMHSNACPGCASVSSVTLAQFLERGVAESGRPADPCEGGGTGPTEARLGTPSLRPTPTEIHNMTDAEFAARYRPGCV